MEQPPVIEAEPASSSKVTLGRIGVCCSVAALAALFLMWLAQPG